MKKIYITLLMLFFCLYGNAQWSIGVKGGISIPDLKGNSEQSKGYTSRKGIYGGIFTNVALNRSFSLQTEINFSPQGGQRNGLQQVPGNFLEDITLPPGTNLYARFDNTAIINYLEVPVLLVHTSGNKIKYQLLLGPYFGFRIEARTNTKGSSLLYVDEKGSVPLELNGNPLPPVSFESNTNIKGDIKTATAGVQGGIALIYPAGRGHLFIEGRAIRGLTNIQTDTKQNGKNQTGSVAVSLGYSFFIRSK